MSLFPDDPFKQLADIRKEFDRFFSGFPFEFSWDDNPFGNIKIDLHQTDYEIIAICDIPGLEKKEDLHIHVVNDLLSIRGTINNWQEVKGEKIYRKERYASSFQRTIALPSPVSSEGIKANYKNGVLHIRMPKTEKTKNHYIDVEFE